MILKKIWKYIQRKRMLKKNIKLKGTVYFNQNTQFGGYNKISFNSKISDSVIGRFSYMGRNNKLENVVIGKFCSMGSDISIIDATHPSSVFVSTHPAFYSTMCQAVKTFSDDNVFDEHLSIDGRKLIIGNDVWVGHGVTFMAGVKVGDGAIVGAKALVTKDVPPYAIVGGIPAKVLRYRFTEEQIAFLEAFKWWNKDDEWLKAHLEQMRSIETFIKDFKA